MRYLILIVMTLLAACGGGGGGSDDRTDNSGGSPPPPDPRIARIDSYDALRLEILGDPDADIAGYPLTDLIVPETLGQMAFAGSVSIRAETSVRPSVLAGDLALEVDFEDNAITGQMTRFFGTGPDRVLRDFTGVVTIESGTVGGTVANSWDLNYSGVLTAPGQAVALDGTVNGTFLGNPLSAMAGSELEAQLVYNGNVVGGVVTLFSAADP
ncbi:hypothetical protein [Yoonia sediminilitoris]|uniref:Transferrin-binding protein B C-lobe/N-lobe beta barrel domain-containing protein n=1 Tax=Yoonia sediminilitoris TaxID=1286148 RepID=A0A2T6KDX9_9RHOB|nr:hypothetical protein [Yoonia sediminilitoris]PUB13223.1 hypothetical protein C8N45_108144 [Yoonia sediminilitoris]RCW94558.1 hypothetical protein DFP92_108145 [Yoonia sediminilitoris]